MLDTFVLGRLLVSAPWTEAEEVGGDVLAFL
jgi:hypothetical protein